MKEYEIDKLAREYALTNEQLLDYLLLNNVDVFNKNEQINKPKIREILKKLNLSKQHNDHSNKSSFKRIKIEKLFGKYNYDLVFENDIVIWVSENGVGKTTILNVIVAILNADERTLFDINFKKIEIFIDEKSYIIDKENYSQLLKSDSEYQEKIEYLVSELDIYLPRNYSLKLKNELNYIGYISSDILNEIILRLSRDDFINNDHLVYMIHKLKDFQYKYFSKILVEIKNKLREEVVFYPTYRRVEVGFDRVFSRYNNNELSPKYMGFGMEDVKKNIKDLLDKLRKDANIAYIRMNGKIISELLQGNIRNYITPVDKIDKHKVEVVIKRIGENRIKNKRIFRNK